MIIIAVFSDGDTSEVDSDTKVETATEPKENAAETKDAVKEEPKEEAKEDNVPREYKSALKKRKCMQIQCKCLKQVFTIS